MGDNDMKTTNLINSDLKDRLKTAIQATDEELNDLEKLLKIQKEKMTNERGSRRQPSVVIDGFLYHGDLGHAIDLPLLLELGIKYIINLCDCPLDEDISKHFQVLWISDVEDSIESDIKQHFDRTNNILSSCKQNNEKVLVHCQAGVSRSSSIVLAYLIKYDKLSLQKAYEHLLERRPVAAPNYGFLLQLIRYEKEIQDKTQHQENDGKKNPIEPVKDLTDL